MPSYNYFNFEDDSNSVDTDPTPDPPVASPVDGIQDDVTNYFEPGEGSKFDGADVSVFATNSSPDEPGAQQDHIPPVRKLIKKGTPRNKPPDNLNDEVEPTRVEDDSGYLPEEYLPLEDEIDYGPENFYIDPIDDSVETVVSFLAGKNKFQNKFTSRFARRIDKVIDQWEKDNGIVVTNPENDHRTIRDFFTTFKDTSIWTENLLDYFSTLDREEKAREFGLTSDELDESGYKSSYETLSEFADTYNTNNWSGGGTWIEALRRLFVNSRADELVKSTVDIVSDSDTVERLLANLPVEDELNIIVDTDDAESVNNPTGIGEFFDRAVISGPLDMMAGSIVDDGLSMIEAALRNVPEPMQVEVTGIEGLEGVDFLNLLESSMGYDLNDYLGDLTENSDIIEFQNLGDSALENFDGLL